MVTILPTLYYGMMGVSALICVVDLVFAMLRKKVLRMVACFGWILVLLVSGISTWIYFQGYKAIGETVTEFYYIMTGIENASMLANVCLFSGIAALVCLIVAIVVIVRRIVKGIKTGVKYTHDTMKESVRDFNDGVKDLFHREEKREEPVETVAETKPEKEEIDVLKDKEPFFLKLNKSKKEEKEQEKIELKLEKPVIEAEPAEEKDLPNDAQ